ncbi:PTS sugar transporter subunit IIB [Salibacterium halotolerans]|uniref:PTS system, cellobiose-specific IIB component n=1 Tax=Salibacterium halotolerans TaxID=1884432 RepID=A0A1I5V4Q2_9BACI|nr:PTS sugar transporter subunit IIB [Salibacterium halotolerans]SFQ02503.1 PTS system, cellobiose-specific IIB component [Salibacterium halotolerans]
MKIALVCSAGMSTSMLVKNMRQAAEQKGIEAEIDAYAEGELNQHMEELEVILIGPQVRYLKQRISGKADSYNIPVDVIDNMAYGTMNGDKVLQQALNLTS